MALNNRGLGRGIQALFEGARIPENGNGEEGTAFRLLPITAIIPNPDQPRKTFDQEQLEELAASIRTHGILQPLLVRASAQSGTYQLIAGERRLRAAKLAGLSEAPALVRALTDQETLIVALLENLQREDLNPIEEARGLEALRHAMNAGIEELAETLGQARSTISNSLRLLGLAPEIQKDVAERRLSTSHAKILAGLPQATALILREKILADNLTTRQTTEVATFWHENQRFPWEAGTPKKTRTQKPANPWLSGLGRAITARLGCTASVNGNGKSGKIVLNYASNAQLNEILEKMGLKREDEAFETASS